MSASSPTRERILDAAVELFSEQGFRGTSITQIETAAGLAPGAGGIYHHFRTKESLLEEAVARQLDRAAALRDIGRIMVGLGDLRVELTLLARYLLSEIDNERAVLRILATESRNRPDLLGRARELLLDRTYARVGAWLQAQTGLDQARAEAVTAVGVGALLAHRLVPLLFGAASLQVADDDFIPAWVAMILCATEEKPC
jgi:AcrR family transcriptional regulator